MNKNILISLAVTVGLSIFGCDPSNSSHNSATTPPSLIKDPNPILDRNAVIPIANRAAEHNGYSLNKYAPPKASYDNGSNCWFVRYEGIVNPSPGNFFIVRVFNDSRVIVSGGD